MSALLIAAAVVLAPSPEHSSYHRHAVRHTFPHVAHSTAYSACSSGSITAMGTRTHFGEVAQNTFRLGTWLELSRPVFGRRRFRIEDRIGFGSELDVWLPSCGAATRYGRRTVRYRVLPR